VVLLVIASGTLSQGTFGKVKKAIQNLTRQPVAIKILKKAKSKTSPV